MVLIAIFIVVPLSIVRWEACPLKLIIFGFCMVPSPAESVPAGICLLVLGSSRLRWVLRNPAAAGRTQKHKAEPSSTRQNPAAQGRTPSSTRQNTQQHKAEHPAAQGRTPSSTRQNPAAQGRTQQHKACCCWVLGSARLCWFCPLVAGPACLCLILPCASGACLLLLGSACCS